jgi:hypothetical protein
MFDAMDIGVFGVFVWFGIKDAIKVFREDGGEANDS